jgi:hypothetical protein
MFKLEKWLTVFKNKNHFPKIKEEFSIAPNTEK